MSGALEGGRLRSTFSSSRGRSVAELLSGLASQRLQPQTHIQPFATGFEPLDAVLAGGFRTHDLTLVGGLPGVGKTIATLQWARQMAVDGHTVVYACYEHDEHVLLARLLSLEAALAAGPDDVSELDRLRAVMFAYAYAGKSLEGNLTERVLFRAAQAQLSSYAERLILVRGSGAHTDLAALRRLVAHRRKGGTALFVDYLQKVAVNPEPEREADKVRRVAEGLKELALDHDVTVIAVVAANHEGLDARRLRLHHLRGSSALAYEADVAILLNDKVKAVSKVHIAYGAGRAQQYRQQVVFTIEKNRGGPAMVDMEFRKDFANYSFKPGGNYVAERLVDERLDEE